MAAVFAVGATVGVTTIEYEPGAVADLQALLDRLIAPEGEYRHNALNHDTNAHSHLRAALIGPSETIPDRRRRARPGDLAAGRPAGLRRPPARADRLGAGPVLRCATVPRLPRRRRPSRPLGGIAEGALYSAVAPVAACAPVASLEKESPSRQGAAVFENSTACALGSNFDPVCVQVRSADPSRARRT